MIHLSAVVLLLASSVALLAQTWTVHICPDNYTRADVYGPPIKESWGNVPAWYSEVCFDSFYGTYGTWVDWHHETLSYWGYEIAEMGSNYATFYAVSNDTQSAFFEISGPGPDCNNCIDGALNVSGGEFWIDFASDGTARVSTLQPSDFGKWAWDGSVNPSWAEPLSAKRSHGKGHK